MLIAKETARQLGMGTNIQGANKLPSFDASEGIPKDLAEKYGDMILEADGFAQVFPEHKVRCSSSRCCCYLMLLLLVGAVS